MKAGSWRWATAQSLDPRAQAAFERHLKSCGACGEVVAAQQAVWEALDEWRLWFTGLFRLGAARFRGWDGPEA